MKKFAMFAMIGGVAVLAPSVARACACGCGVFEGSYAVIGSVDKVVPVDLHLRGCPPRPIELLRGLVALVDRATGKA